MSLPRLVLSFVRPYSPLPQLLQLIYHLKKELSVDLPQISSKFQREGNIRSRCSSSSKNTRIQLNSSKILTNVCWKLELCIYYFYWFLFSLVTSLKISWVAPADLVAGLAPAQVPDLPTCPPDEALRDPFGRRNRCEILPDWARNKKSGRSQSKE